MTSPAEICGFYSITETGEYEESIESLRYFWKPALPLDLNKGIDDIKEKLDSYYERKLNRILTFLVNHKDEYLNKADAVGDGDKLIPSADYITSRSVLRMMYCSSVFSWDILATKYKGNIYLCKYIPKEEIEEDKNNSVFKKFRNYGPMFEHHCLSEHPNKRPDMSKDCDANTQFFCVIRRNLVNRQFLFGAEVDGTDSETALDAENPRNWKPNQFIELKVNFELTTQNRKYNFENIKVHKILAQSYLSGIERVYIGFRNNDGIVRQIRRFSVDELNEISRRNWKGSKSGLEFLNYFLDKFEVGLKDINCPYTTIKYHYNKDTKRLSFTKYEGESEYSFLPQSYINEMK